MTFNPFGLLFCAIRMMVSFVYCPVLAIRIGSHGDGSGNATLTEVDAPLTAPKCAPFALKRTVVEVVYAVAGCQHRVSLYFERYRQLLVGYVDRDNDILQLVN